jgi:hypothetical protein
MSETAQSNDQSPLDFKKFSEDFSKELTKISSGMIDLGKKVEDKTSALESKVESLKTKGEDDDNGTKFSDYDKEENQKIEQLATKIADKKINQLEQKFEASKKYENDCLAWDKKAGEDYPHIKLPEIRSKVEAELSTMKVIGKDKNGNNLYEPDAVYNASARVIARMSANGQLGKLPEPENLDFGNYNTQIKGKGVNEIQIAISERLGIKPERAKEIYKNFQPRRRN